MEKIFDLTVSLPKQIVSIGLDQLRHFQKTNDTAYLRRDIEGYEEVIKMSDKTIRAFLEIKDRYRNAGNKFKDNLAVIEHLKKQNLWE